MIGEGPLLVTLVRLDIHGLHLVMGDIGLEVVIIHLLKIGITRDRFHPKMDTTAEIGIHVLHHTMSQGAVAGV